MEDLQVINSAIQKACAICSRYNNIMVSISGGADSDVMLDLLLKGTPKEKFRFVFFDTGIEYAATKEHLDELEKKYGITIERERALVPVPLGCKNYGVPFLSKHVSEMIEYLQKRNFDFANDGNKSLEELCKIYPKTKSALRWWCNDYPAKDGVPSKFNIGKHRKLKEFMIANPPDFKISARCCNGAKKDTSHAYEAENDLDLKCIGLRKSEGGIRAAAYRSCFDFNEKNAVQSFRPIWWFTDKDKELYCEMYNVQHSRCYTEYGMKRTGCFLGDTEILTNKGYIRLDALQGNEKVLSINESGKKVFTDYRKIELPFDGDLIRVKLQESYVLTTPDHKFIGYNRDNKTWETKFAKNISRLSIPSNFRFLPDDSKLSNIERIYIAIQADGHLIKRQNFFSCEFHLKRQRKIERLRYLLNACNIPYSERTLKDLTTTITFRINNITKNLWDMFDIENIGVTEAREIIAEMVMWDGYIDKANRYCYSNCNIDQIKFYETIAGIAGYSSYVGLAHNDDRWNKCYLLMVYTDENRNFKQVKMKTQYYKGTVHCVDIGDNLIMLKANGKTFVSYNCAGCPFNSKYEDSLLNIEEHEPLLYIACNNIFGKSYEYTRKYREFKKGKRAKKKKEE